MPARRSWSGAAPTSGPPRWRPGARSSRTWSHSPASAWRLAQGRTDAAEAAIRRVVAETSEKLRRAKLLPAQVEILLAVGEVKAAADAAREMVELAESYNTPAVRAVADHAHGAVLLAEGDARAAATVTAYAYQHRLL